MKPMIKELTIIGLIGIVIPGLLFYGLSRKDDGPIPAETTSPPSTAAGEEKTSAQRKITVLLDDGSTEEQALDDYITGVVLAEMPADFEEQALMAQAVAARTYALRRSQTLSKHDNADVCGNPSCCQAYLSLQDYADRGGTVEDYEKIRRAVEATSGQVLMYDGQMIEATYFSCSGGMTEDARAVWGAEFPYLIAQPSPGEETSDQYTQSVSMSSEEFLDRLGAAQNHSQAPLIGEITYTDGGGVDWIEVAGERFTGVEIRKLLSLRSTAFFISAVGENVVITTKGYGHRVGMSQYGADAMALEGNSYQQILAYYYPGTEIAQLG